MKNQQNGGEKKDAKCMLMWAAGAVVCVGFWAACVIMIGCSRNFYFTEETVLRKLQALHPNITKIIEVDRQIWRRSAITVEEAGSPKKYFLDSNVFLEYEFSEEQASPWIFAP